MTVALESDLENASDVLFTVAFFTGIDCLLAADGWCLLGVVVLVVIGVAIELTAAEIKDADANGNGVTFCGQDTKRSVGIDGWKWATLTVIGPPDCVSGNSAET